MAEGAKKGFPVIPVKHWWTLRERFRKAIPSKVDAKYLASVLDISEGSAQNNILPTLRTTKIIDDEGKPTDRAVKWRDDHDYPKVCEQIRKDVYPAQLLEVAPGIDEREAARRWFANHSGGGESLINKTMTVYMLLCEADPIKAAAAPASSTGNTRIKKKTIKKGEKGAPTKPQVDTNPVETDNGKPPIRQLSGPAIHFNVQIHISPDATAEQIDQLFASMGKHLKQLSA